MHLQMSSAKVAAILSGLNVLNELPLADQKPAKHHTALVPQVPTAATRQLNHDIRAW